MKSMAVKLFLKALRIIGIKKAIRLAWDYYLYPKAMQWAKSNDYPDWDEKLVEAINKNIDKILELI